MDSIQRSRKLFQEIDQALTKIITKSQETILENVLKTVRPGPLDGAGDGPIADVQDKEESPLKTICFSKDVDCGEVILKKGTKLIVQESKAEPSFEAIFNFQRFNPIPAVFRRSMLYGLVVFFVYAITFCVLVAAQSFSDPICLDESQSVEKIAVPDEEPSFQDLKDMFSVLNPFNYF
jgi:hypothetical protein